MAKKKLERTESKQSALLARLRENSESINSARGAMDSWRYIDFINPATGHPSIALEWLFGSRGLLAGRIMQLRAKFSKGKSSFMYLIYAAAQRTSEAFCFHVETEGAGAPADHIESFGCDPNDLIVAEIPSLEECLAQVDEVICTVRGGFGGGINATTGRATKSKFTDPIDPNNESPIVVGIDSLSSLGTETAVEVDIANVGSTAALSYHTRKMREYFRNRVGRFKDTQTLLLLASHETASIQTGRGGFGGGGSSKTSLAQEAIGIHATYGVDLESYSYSDKDGNRIGDRVKMHTFKNKISPRGREMDLYLVWGAGFDLGKSDIEFLMSHPMSPFAPVNGQKILYSHAHGITCKPLSDKSFKTPQEFLDAFYGNEELLAATREALRIRGFGFAFEVEAGLESEIETEDGDGLASGSEGA